MTWAIIITVILFIFNIGGILWIRNKKKERTHGRMIKWHICPRNKGWGVMRLDFRDLARTRWYTSLMFPREERIGYSQVSEWGVLVRGPGWSVIKEGIDTSQGIGE